MNLRNNNIDNNVISLLILLPRARTNVPLKDEIRLM